MEKKETYFDFMDAVMASGLTTVERMVALVIAKRFYIKGDAFPGNELIAQNAGIKDIRTVIKAKKSLSEKGFITSVRRGVKKTNVYICAVPIIVPAESVYTSGASSQDEVTPHVPSEESDYASDAGVNVHPVQSECTSDAECMCMRCISNREEENISNKREEYKREEPLDIKDENPVVLLNSEILPTSLNLEIDSLPSNVETVRSEPNIEEEKYVYRDFKEYDWKTSQEEGLDDWTYYPLFKRINSELIRELQGVHSWSRKEGWVAAISDYFYENDYTSGRRELVTSGSPVIDSKQIEWENETW